MVLPATPAPDFALPLFPYGVLSTADNSCHQVGQSDCQLYQSFLSRHSYSPLELHIFLDDDHGSCHFSLSCIAVFRTSTLFQAFSCIQPPRLLLFTTTASFQAPFANFDFPDPIHSSTTKYCLFCFTKASCHTFLSAPMPTSSYQTQPPFLPILDHSMLQPSFLAFPPGSMAGIIRPYSKEQFISKGLRSWLTPSTLTKVRRDTKRTLEVLRRGGQKAISTDFTRFARTELSVTTCSGTMLRTSDVAVSRILMADVCGPFEQPPPEHFLSQFVIAELSLQEGTRAFRFYDPETAALRFQFRDDGDFVPIFVSPSYFVCEIAGGEGVLVEFFSRQQRVEEETGAQALVELAAPSIDRSITIRRAPGPVAAAPQAPGPRYLDLSPLSSSALSLCTIIVGDRTRTADDFLQALRSAGITATELPSAPVRIDSQAGYPLFAFYPGSVDSAGRVFYAVSDIAGSPPSFLSFFPGPERKPYYELQQAVLVPVSFLEHFPHGQAAPSIQRLVRTHHAFSSAHVGLGRESAQPDPEQGPRKVVRVYFPSTAHFRIWARDFPSGVPVTVSPESGQQVRRPYCLLLPVLGSFHPLHSQNKTAAMKCCTVCFPVLPRKLWRPKTPSKSGQNMSKRETLLCSVIRTLSTVQNGPSFAQIREDPSKIRQFQFCTFFRLCARSPAKLQFLTTASLSCPFLRSFSPSAATRTPCPAFHPLSTDFTFSGRFTLPSASPQVSARLTLRLPPGGFTLQAPAECVLSAHESQLLLRLADSMDDVILSSLAQARTDLHVNPADHTAEDAVFTDNDQAGNVIVGFSTDPAVAIILTRLRFRLYPEGVDVPASSYGVTPRLRAALNSLPSRPAQGQFAFDASTFTAATFPAVDVVVAQYHALTGAAVGQPAADPPALRIVDISGDADAGDAGVAAAGRFFSSAIPTRALDGCQSELIPVFAPPDFCSRRASVSFPVLLPSAYAVCHRSAPNASCLRPSSIQRTPLPPWSSRFSHRLLSALVHFRCVLPRFPRSLAVLFDNHPQQPPDCPSARSTHPPFPPPFTPRPSFALPSPRPSHSATSILAIDSSSTDGSMPASEFTSPHVLIPRFPLSAAWHSTLEHRPTHSTCTALSDVSALSDVLDSPFASSPAPHLVSIFVASRPALPFIVRLPPFHTVDAAPSTFDMHLFASSITLGIAVFHWLPSFISMICSAYHLWRRASCLLSRQHSRSAARSYTRRFTAHTACQTRRLFASYFTLDPFVLRDQNTIYGSKRSFICSNP